MNAASELRDQGYVQFAWFSNGHVMVRSDKESRAIRIRGMKDLEKIRVKIEIEEEEDSEQEEEARSRSENTTKTKEGKTTIKVANMEQRKRKTSQTRSEI